MGTKQTVGFDWNVALRPSHKRAYLQFYPYQGYWFWHNCRLRVMCFSTTLMLVQKLIHTSFHLGIMHCTHKDVAHHATNLLKEIDVVVKLEVEN